jgi:hypothetical protein
MAKQLVFDTSDATSIAHSDSVGAFVRSSDGTLITHSTVGGKEALDVSIADGVNVEVDLSHVDDSVRLGDGTTLFTGTTVGADTGLDVNVINASIAVTATDLDIRDLAFATDSVTAHQGGTWDIGTVTTLTGITNDVNIADGGNSITVDAVNLDIRDLTAASDSVASHLFDGAGTALTSTLVGADQALDVNVANTISVEDAALANTAIANAAATLAVANTAQDAVASPLANRKYLYIRNQDNKNIYIGSTGVTASNGFPVSPGMILEMRAGAAVDIEFVGSAGSTPEIRTLELS